MHIGTVLFLLSAYFGSLNYGLCAEEEIMVIDSTLADYDGNKITLSGNVVVEHEIGQISANQVVLTPENEEKKIRFAFLKMNDNVKICLKDGGQLSCSCADLDYTTLTGKFSGNHQQEYVVYNENCRDKNGVGVPLVVKSRQMNVNISREELNKEPSPRSYIREIRADNHVTVNYNHDFIIAADYAMYQRLPLESENHPPAQMSGLISFRAAEQNGLCQVTNRNGDLIRANQICIDTSKRHLLFAYPKGAIFTPGEGEEISRIDFSSDTMTWEEPRDLLILRDHVAVNQKGFGKITNNEEVQVFRHLVNGRKVLRSIDSSGETILNYIDEDKNTSHILTCYGKVIVDHEHLITHLDSPRDGNGNVLDGKQAFFQDRLGEIYADKVILNYEYIDHNIVPTKIILKGNVQILNRTSTDIEDPGKFLQYALADAVEYIPQTKEMNFSSLNNQRVLFFDKINNIQVSAPALKIQRDPDSKKDSIQGLGDVRLSFLETELEQLRKRFGFDVNKKEDKQEISQEKVSE